MPASLVIDQEIFQDLVKFYGETFQLPPLGAKIYAYVIFDFEKKGICFEEFVQVFAASKSSVSANLNLLLNAKLIKDFNTLNERKRFFVINDDFVTLRFLNIINKMKQEIVILDKLQAFWPIKDEKKQQRLESYKMLLNKNITNIEETLHKI
ncbi:transcriptional regulator [Chryseobacterium sp. 6424]|uniref:transcriptional regulator n=1 Tax=Chryseobacterium sp. 6424 TaxID=2039166 RepID=UPI000EFB6720|nr:transcriptional regulator [Chryseobacterium sp. 6424]AYO58615.1 transcriptional regulator [Chryseobacterium sp. 6424]